MRKLVIYLWVLFVTTAVACDPIADEKGLEGQTAPSGESAQVVNVIDGDTIDVEAEGEVYRVRYIGVDTPERDEPYYEEARKANQDMVAGQAILLVKDVSETDRFGRLLRYVYLADGTFVNAELIEQGYGRVVTFPPDVAQVALLTDLQQEAREAGRGLWGQAELQSLPRGCDTCGKNSYDCRDFNSQTAAQACYDACMELVGEDVHHLDGGGDGVVCESLPK
jgi:endonuclease YncB( thermonuclease family)